MKIGLSIALAMTFSLSIFATPKFMEASRTTISSVPDMANTGQDASDETLQLLKKLYFTSRLEGNGMVLEVPKAKVRGKVREEIIELANQSLESRAKVIITLIQVVDDPTWETSTGTDQCWIAAIELIALLGATEGIDSLIRNIYRSEHPGLGGTPRRLRKTL